MAEPNILDDSGDQSGEKGSLLDREVPDMDGTLDGTRFNENRLEPATENGSPLLARDDTSTGASGPTKDGYGLLENEETTSSIGNTSEEIGEEETSVDTAIDLFQLGQNLSRAQVTPTSDQEVNIGDDAVLLDQETESNSGADAAVSDPAKEDSDITKEDSDATKEESVNDSNPSVDLLQPDEGDSISEDSSLPGALANHGQEDVGQDHFTEEDNVEAPTEKTKLLADDHNSDFTDGDVCINVDNTETPRDAVYSNFDQDGVIDNTTSNHVIPESTAGVEMLTAMDPEVQDMNQTGQEEKAPLADRHQLKPLPIVKDHLTVHMNLGPKMSDASTDELSDVEEELERRRKTCTHCRRTRACCITLYFWLVIFFLGSIVAMAVIGILVVDAYRTAERFGHTTCDPQHSQYIGEPVKCSCGKGCTSNYPCMEITVGYRDINETLFSAPLQDNEAMLHRKVGHARAWNACI